MYLTDIYRPFHTKTKAYIFLSASYGIYSKIEHIIRHKASLNRHKKIEINLCIKPPKKQQKAHILMETEQLSNL